MKKWGLAFCLLVVFAMFVNGQSFEWLPGGEYNADIPTPAQFFGYEIGDYLTDNHQMVAYIHALEKKSPRVKVFQYGETVERRKLWILAVSSPENIAKLEEIRTTVGRLADPRQTTSAQAQSIANSAVPIGWMNFANDGGETSAFEAGLQLAYQLTAGTDQLTKKILDNTVTIINPAFNPDSHQAFVAWMKNSTIRGGTADNAANEHYVEWFASSDGNHYKIDINRDGFALTQRESTAGAALLKHWNPQVWIDNHGEPNEYYMAPFTAPVNENYPDSIKKWADVIGRNSAKYFDRFGWTYTKDENYDLYFPGYWDSYPAFNGAVAATYETNGGGYKGFRWERPDGTIVTFRESIQKHFIADMATLEALADNKKGILADFYGFFRSGMDEVSNESIKTYVIHETVDPGRASDLVETLLKHNIEVYQTAKEIKSGNAQDYFNRTSRGKTFPAGSYVVPLRQPKKRLIKTLLEPDPKMEASFLETVEKRLARDAKVGPAAEREGPGFYDITAWALPLHYDVETSFTGEEINVGGMQRVLERPKTGGTFTAEAKYAYSFSARHNSGFKLAGKLLQEGYNVAIALQPTTVGGVKLEKGAFLARVKRNPVSLAKDIQKYSRDYDVKVVPLNTAWGDGGISLGSEYVRDLKKPSIMVATKQPTRAVTFGSVYSVLDQRFDLDFSAVRTNMIADVDLKRYNVIVLPDGSPAGYERTLGTDGVRRLRNWIEEGGTLIALKGAAEFTTRENVKFTDVEMVRTQIDSDKPIESVPGSIFKAEINTDYYLGLGMREEVPVLFRGGSHMTPTKLGANIAIYKPDGHIMGHTWESTMPNLAGKLFAADVPVGRGHVILFADDPTFRAYWNGMDRLFMGSIILSTGF